MHVVIDKDEEANGEGETDGEGGDDE
jgi:hypothetical protein